MSHIITTSQNFKDAIFRKQSDPIETKELFLPESCLADFSLSKIPEINVPISTLNKSSGEPTTKYKNTTELICLVFSFIVVVSIGVAWISSLLIIAHH